MGLTFGGGTLYFGKVDDPDKAIPVKEVALEEYAEDSDPAILLKPEKCL